MAAPRKAPKRPGARGEAERLMARRQQTRMPHKDVAEYAASGMRGTAGVQKSIDQMYKRSKQEGIRAHRAGKTASAIYKAKRIGRQSKAFAKHVPSMMPTTYLTPTGLKAVGALAAHLGAKAVGGGSQRLSQKLQARTGPAMHKRLKNLGEMPAWQAMGESVVRARYRLPKKNTPYTTSWPLR
jgi:hypothetical protein